MVVAEIPWMRHVCIFLDNAGNTNKNRFLFSWGMEMVKNLKLDYIGFCFLVAGYTKFALDCVFALIANAYNRDVFTAAELKEVCGIVIRERGAAAPILFSFRLPVCYARPIYIYIYNMCSYA